MSLDQGAARASASPRWALRRPGALSFIIALSLLAHVALSAASQTIFEGFVWAQEPFHSAVEIGGSLIALWVARVLLGLERQGKGTSYNISIASALIGMGILDGFHAAVPVGNLFVWLHSVATFVGGLLLLLVWIPRPKTGGIRWLAREPVAVALASIAIGAVSLSLPEYIPAMVVGGAFSSSARGLNVLGGIFLCVASIRLVWTYRTTRNIDDLLFFLHCALFGSAAIMFDESTLWDSAWWGWHALRLLAYGVALWFVIRTEREARRDVTLALKEANSTLEARVAERTSEVLSVNADLQAQIDARKRIQEERERLHRELLEASRKAGMAEVASGILHDVGNVLNSINVSTQQASELLAIPEIEALRRTAALISTEVERGGGADFFERDARGKKIPLYLERLGDALEARKLRVAQELECVDSNVRHIMQVVNNQQLNAARPVLVLESMSVADLFERSMSVSADVRESRPEGVEIQWRIELPRDLVVLTDRHKVQQILVNLLRNAIRAVSRHGTVEPRIALRASLSDDELLEIEVEDNGGGICAANLVRVFHHAFTTYEDGFGFGLHMSSNNAAVLGGKLSARSDGEGMGATFTLTIPVTAADPRTLVPGRVARAGMREPSPNPSTLRD